jgi:hypothetical protein
MMHGSVQLEQYGGPAKGINPMHGNQPHQHHPSEAPIMML